jgi:hypothetical protein
METYMSGAVAIEGMLLSFLLALWMTWLALSGLFRLMPVASSPVTGRIVQPIRCVANRQEANRRRDAA